MGNGPLQTGGQMPVMNQQQPGASDDGGTMGGDLPGSGAASDEEQKNYDKVVTAGLEAIFGDDKTSSKIVKQLKAGADTPARTIAMVATNILGKFDDDSNGTIPAEVIIPATAEILTNIGELAKASGTFEVDATVINQAIHNMLTELANEYDLSPEEIMPELEALGPEVLEQIQQSQGAYYNG